MKGGLDIQAICLYIQKEMSESIRYSVLNNGLIVPNYIIKKSKGPIVFDFFAGAGGFSSGFIQAGWTVIGALEWDPGAAITYMVNLGSYPINIHFIDGEADKERLNAAIERNWGIRTKKQREDILNAKIFDYEGLYREGWGSGLSGSGYIRHYPDKEPVRNFWFGDIRKIKGQDILDALGLRQGDLDCICGGPPCQGYSRAGKQQIADPRNNLVYEYGRLIVELQPKTFVMEEVPDIVNFFDQDGVPVLDKFCLMLSEGGYGKWEMLKKALLMQAGCAAGIKSERGNASLKNSKTEIKKQEELQEQLSLF
jgi:DNA (cytosine-5)-methyltransferase 1